MQYDKTTIKSENKDFAKKIFLSSAAFKYPTLKLKQLELVKKSKKQRAYLTKNGSVSVAWLEIITVQH